MGSFGSPTSAPQSQDPEHIDAFKQLETKLAAGKGKEVVQAYINEAEKDSVDKGAEVESVLLAAGELAIEEDLDSIPGAKEQLDALNAQFHVVLEATGKEFALAEDGSLELVLQAPKTHGEALTRSIKTSFQRAQDAIESGDFAELLTVVFEALGDIQQFIQRAKGGALKEPYSSKESEVSKSKQDRMKKILNTLDSSTPPKSAPQLRTEKKTELGVKDTAITAAKTGVTTAENVLEGAKTNLDSAKSANPSVAADITAAKNAVKTAEKNLATAKTTVETLTKERDELQKDIDALKEIEEEQESVAEFITNGLHNAVVVFIKSKDSSINTLGTALKDATVTVVDGKYKIKNPADPSAAFLGKVQTYLEANSSTATNPVDASNNVDPSVFVDLIRDIIQKA